MKAKPIQMLAVALVPPVYTTSQLLWWEYLCVFLVPGKLARGMVLRIPFSWKETRLIFQSPKVLSKSNSYFLRSCSKIFWYLALGCLQLSLRMDWRSTLLYLASDIWVTDLEASNVLFGSMVMLLISFNAWSVLAPCRRLMFLIGKWLINGYCLGFKVQHES